MKTRKGNKKCVINIDAVKQQIEQELAGDVDFKKFCSALPGLHAFTGCDSVSAFAGKGKAKCYNLLRKNLGFVETLESLGEKWNVEVLLLFIRWWPRDECKQIAIQDLRFKKRKT